MLSILKELKDLTEKYRQKHKKNGAYADKKSTKGSRVDLLHNAVVTEIQSISPQESLLEESFLKEQDLLGQDLLGQDFLKQDLLEGLPNLQEQQRSFPEEQGRREEEERLQEQQRFLEEEKRRREEELNEKRLQQQNDFKQAKLQDNPQLNDKDEEEHVLKEKYNHQSKYQLEPGSKVFFFDKSRSFEIHMNSYVIQYEGEPREVWFNKQEDILYYKVFHPKFKKFMWAPAGNLKYITTKQETSSRYQKVFNIPLFPNNMDPAPEHVQQSNLGDCYLQAALASLSDRNPKYLKNIMEDDGESVTVRLFKVQENKFGIPQFTPKAIRVEKSVPIDTSGDFLYNRGCLWVKMIQKAYVVGGFAGRQDKENQNQTPQYNNIAGGSSYHALQVLMGQRSENITLGRQTKDTNIFGAMAVIKQAFKNNELNENSPLIQYIYNQLDQQVFQIQKSYGSVAVQITLEDINQAFISKGNNQENNKKEKILGELEQYCPGKLGTGKYSQKQLETFSQIKQALSERKPVTAGTHDYIKQTKDGFTGLAGEQKADGLVGNHAYSILNTCTSNRIDQPEPKEDGKYKLIQIRNPWAKYSFRYESDNNGGFVRKEKEDQQGKSWLDLSELTKFFTNVNIGGKLQ